MISSGAGAIAIVAWTLADALVEKLGGDSLSAMQAAWEEAWGAPPQ